MQAEAEEAWRKQSQQLAVSDAESADDAEATVQVIQKLRFR